MTRRAFTLCCLWLSGLFLLGCDRPALTPIPRNGSILAFGDSLTSGTGVHSSDSYPSVLAELSGRQVVNAGVSGELTAQGRARLARTLDETSPVLLILLEGGNDILQNEDPAETRRNLAAMIELAQSRSIEIVLIGVPGKSLFSDVAPFYRELADEYGLVFDGRLLAELLRTPRYKSDAVHFNRQGYRVMAEAIFGLLVENGAL